MNKSRIIALSSVFALVLSVSSCKKDKETLDSETLQTQVLANISENVCKASYVDMYAKAQALQTSVDLLVATPNDANLATAQNNWRIMRTTWEQTESWLFGPVEANNIDPRIDTWPVDFNQLEIVLSSNVELSDAYIDGLEDELKGFHPIEYLLWGQSGEKKASDFTSREKEYLKALTTNLVKLSLEVKDTWEDGYDAQLTGAGTASSTDFGSKKEAFLQIVDAMGGICDEVANAKMFEPFDAQNPLLEESPFSKNSFTDFQNNLKGIMVIYKGDFSSNGKGLEDIVRTNNLSLDSEIKSKYAAALAALQAFGNTPFGTAITTKQSDVQNAMNKINDLAETLDEKLKPFVIQYTN